MDASVFWLQMRTLQIASVMSRLGYTSTDGVMADLKDLES